MGGENKSPANGDAVRVVCAWQARRRRDGAGDADARRPAERPSHRCAQSPWTRLPRVSSLTPPHHDLLTRPLNIDTLRSGKINFSLVYSCGRSIQTVSPGSVSVSSDSSHPDFSPTEPDSVVLVESRAVCFSSMWVFVLLNLPFL